jgi:lipoprotein-anchoring transpeptidase ErfK/SrfK
VLLATLAVVVATLIVPSTGAAAPAMSTRVLQERLAILGYLPVTGVDGRFGPQTRNAVIAFQKWEGLARDGVPGPRTHAALAVASAPTPRTRGPGTRVEVLLDRQLALVVRSGRVLRALHVSTGAKGYRTPTATFEILRKSRWSWSNEYRAWLPFAAYFVRGVALHASARVPVRPASHGCVRVPTSDAKWLYRTVRVGDRVTVLARS